MPSFESEGLSLHYLDEGSPSDPAVLLVHGFASNIRMNWVGPGWVRTLVEAGYRVIAFDHRGHGESDKPHEPTAYEPERMVADALALLDSLGVERAVWFGYSMGARVSAFAALDAPDRVRALILGGLGEGLVTGLDDAEGIAEALLAPDPDAVEGARPRMFRAFADKTGSDRRALAACIATSRKVLETDRLNEIVAPALVAVGTEDDIAGSPHALARLLPNGEAFEIAGRDHMLATGDRTFKAAVSEFLGRQASAT